MATTKGSLLSTESPPFHPTARMASYSPPPPSSSSALQLQQQFGSIMGSTPGMVAPNSAGRTSRSRSSSPFRNVSTSSGSSSSTTTGTNPSANSNAVPKYTFQHQGETLEIRNVWAENVEEEMAVIRELIAKYPYVAMDTEFPGVVAKPVTECFTSDYHYKSLKVNVDLLKIIQLGLSFADEQGNFCPGCPCWQFNFKFDLQGDMFAQDSIDLLANSGISFEDHARHGIDPHLFGELLMVSGLVLDDKVKWVSFHSGYDYGYLLKLLTTTELPSDEKGFFELLRIYFPTIYDIKYMTSLLDGHFFGGLQKLADDLGCQRLGAEHQAGSDSLLTMSTYFALARAKFQATSSSSSSSSSSLGSTDGTNSNGNNIVIDDSKYKNELFGYGTNHTVRKQQAGMQLHHAQSRELSNSSAGSSDI